MGKIYYRPGVRNISGEQIRYRQRIGIVGLVTTLIVFIALVSTRANYIFGLIIFLPAFVAAVGYLQARSKFCAFFGFKGRYSSSETELAKVTDPSEHDLDMTCARMISVQATMVGLVATLVACGILYFFEY